MSESIDLDTHEPFIIGDWQVHPDSGRLIRQGAEVKLEPKVMKVLLHLANNQGKVVSREELESSVWAGTIVGYDAISSSIIKLRKALGDNSRNPEYIETVSKKGYRLIANVDSQSSNVENGTKPEPLGKDDIERQDKEVNDKWTSDSTRNVKTQLISAVIGLCIIFIGWQILDNNRELETSKPQQTIENQTKQKNPSVVVLPFKNLSNDPQQEYFSDGITDDLITDLSGISGLMVIARRTAYAYKQQKVSINEVAKDLGVQYVIEGSIRRDKDNLRVNVELVDTVSGSNLWAQRFDRKTDDIFSVQDDIRRNIINSLSVTLTEQEKQREQQRYTSNFEAYDYFLQGQSALVRRASAAEHKVAQDLMRRATQLDPNFARAHAALAYTLADAYRQAWITDADAMRNEAVAAGNRAIELDPELHTTYWIMGNVYLFMFQDHDKAIEMAKRAVELAPNDNDGLLTLAVAYDYAGNPAKGALMAEEIMARNDSYSSLVPAVAGLAYYQLAKYPEALEAYNKSLEINPTYVSALVHKVLIYYQMGDMDEATFQIDELYNLHPNFDLHAWVAALGFKDKAIIEKYTEDLIKVGLE